MKQLLIYQKAFNDDKSISKQGSCLDNETLALVEILVCGNANSALYTPMFVSCYKQ